MGASADVARAWVGACNGASVDAILALCDPEIELIEASELPGAVSAIGLEAVTRYVAGFDKHWSEWRWEPLEVRESGDRVYMRANLHLRGRASGMEVDREWIYVFTVRDGRLLRQEGFDSEAAGLRAAGLT